LLGGACCDWSDLACFSHFFARSREAVHTERPFAQIPTKGSNLGQESAAPSNHIILMRNVKQRSSASADSKRRTTMQNRINSGVRRVAKWASLPALAMTALLAGAPAASAFDQQATGAERDYALSWHAARGGYGGPYAQAFHEGRVYHHYRGYR
jgi:hypothetical protein